jgi:hypothetical protein
MSRSAHLHLVSPPLEYAVMINFYDLDEVGELTMSGCNIEGQPIMGTVTYPTYTCGHCSNIIVIRPDRTRDRKRCYSCQRVICEKKQICQESCTPLTELAKDHMEAPEQFKRLAPAILQGATSVEEGLARGLILP